MATSLTRRLAAAEQLASPRRLPPTPSEQQYLARAAQILAEKPGLTFREAYLQAILEDI